MLYRDLCRIVVESFEIGGDREEYMCSRDLSELVSKSQFGRRSDGRSDCCSDDNSNLKPREEETYLCALDVDTGLAISTSARRYCCSSMQKGMITSCNALRIEVDNGM
jgi:hypothetical protein